MQIIILILDGISLTAVALIMVPFIQANKILGSNGFDLKRVSLLEKDMQTTSGIRPAGEKLSKFVLARDDVKKRPDFFMRVCFQEVDKASQKALQISKKNWHPPQCRLWLWTQPISRQLLLD